METAISFNQQQLISELKHYRDQTNRLRKINEFYGRIVGVVDLTSLIEAYSIWLMQYVRFKLIGYANPARSRNHFICAEHGPDRRNVMTLADTIIHQTGNIPISYRYCNGIHTYVWTLDAKGTHGKIVLFKNNAPMKNDEMQVMDDSLPVMNESVKKAFEYEEIYHQARRDSLTELPNRLYFDEHIYSIIELAGRHRRPLTLAALDLDRFKRINDTKGHLEGDRVLKLVGTILKKEIRLSDTLIRMGGDEFLIILQETDLEASRCLCKRLCNAIKELDIHTDQGRLGLSIGLAEYKSDISLKQLLSRADDMLYQVKAEGGNGVAG
ncbi:MAG: GGDEF domain-containing protein [Desulfobulbaceae bacterium]|nr:GGDEF domain-containing protein [Desulfobulbaceae bacterium]